MIHVRLDDTYFEVDRLRVPRKKLWQEPPLHSFLSVLIINAHTILFFILNERPPYSFCLRCQHRMLSKRVTSISHWRNEKYLATTHVNNTQTDGNLRGILILG